MAWSFRKSINAGPFRVNFSKSGIGYSIGVKGARISTGPRGTYVNFGLNGVYYRKKIANSPGIPQRPERFMVASDQHTIASANIEELTDSDSKEFIAELTEKARKVSLLTWLGIVPGICFIVLLLIVYCQASREVILSKFVVQTNPNETINIRKGADKTSEIIGTASNGMAFDLLDSSDANWYKVSYLEADAFITKKFASIVKVETGRQTYSRLDDNPGEFWKVLLTGIACFTAFCILLYRKDKKRMYIEINYEFDERIKAVYDCFLNHFNEITTCSKLWQYIYSKRTNDYKYTSGAGISVIRVGVKSTSLDKKPAKFFKTNIKVPYIRLKNADFYFFPERLLVRQGNKFASVFYKHLAIKGSATRFIEDQGVPPDAKVIDYTWRYLNKNGSPDRRFKNNFKIPICQYSEYELTSNTGVNEVIVTSREGALDGFANFLTEIGHFQNKMNIE